MLIGTCHCGAAGWRRDAVPDAVTACNCTICRRYGALWAYGFVNADTHTTGETRVYRRQDNGDGDIDFHFCATCGCVTHFVSVTVGVDDRRRIAVNVRMTDPAMISALPVRHFEGCESFTERPRDDRHVKDVWF